MFGFFAFWQSSEPPTPQPSESCSEGDFTATFDPQKQQITIRNKTTELATIPCNNLEIDRERLQKCVKVVAKQGLANLKNAFTKQQNIEADKIDELLLIALELNENKFSTFLNTEVSPDHELAKKQISEKAQEIAKLPQYADFSATVNTTTNDTELFTAFDSEPQMDCVAIEITSKSPISSKHNTTYELICPIPLDETVLRAPKTWEDCAKRIGSMEKLKEVLDTTKKFLGCDPKKNEIYLNTTLSIEESVLKEINTEEAIEKLLVISSTKNIKIEENQLTLVCGFFTPFKPSDRNNRHSLYPPQVKIYNNLLNTGESKDISHKFFFNPLEFASIEALLKLLLQSPKHCLEILPILSIYSDFGGVVSFTMIKKFMTIATKIAPHEETTELAKFSMGLLTELNKKTLLPEFVAKQIAEAITNKYNELNAPQISNTFSPVLK